MNKRKCEKSRLEMQQTNNRQIKYWHNTKGITLIALVISIIVMLILAGVSLNATIGENGIMTQAKNATYVQSVAVLEEYINNYYVEHYEELSGEESNVLTLTKLEPSWFYIPANEGVGGLRYVVDGEGHALYLIKKSGLPEDIKNQIRGGDAGEGSYADYVALNDVYGVTSDLKVYYCSNGTDTILGASKEAIDSDNPLRKVYTETDNSAIYGLLSDYDTENSEGNKDGVLTAEELKSVTTLTINPSSGITDFSSFYNLISLKELVLDGLTLNNLNGIENCPQLKDIYFKSSVIGNYSSLAKLSKLNHLYLYNIDDNELEVLCNGIKNANFSNLEYLSIAGTTGYESLTGVRSDYDNSNLAKVVKSPKTITKLSSLAELSDTTKKAVKYLSINHNDITGDLTAIKDYTNLILLRCEHNKITSLDGMDNMNNITYLCGVDNKLGTIINEAGIESGEDAITGTSISALANKTQLTQVNLNSNSNLSNVSYFVNNTSLKYLYLENCSKNMVVGNITNIINGCTETRLPVKFLTGDRYKVADYYNASTVTYEELRADLYGNTTIDKLNLEGCTNLTNEQLNTILSSMKQLKFLALKGNTTLTSLDFVGTGKVEGLIELDVRDTGLKGENSLTALNEGAKSLKTLRVSDGSDFKNITTTINRLEIDGQYNYWYGDQAGSASGLNVSNFDVLKKLESVIEIENLQMGQWGTGDSVGDKGTVLDLRNSKLKYVRLGGIIANIYFPNSITKILFNDGGIPIISENSELLTEISIAFPKADMNLKKEFFSSLVNAKKLRYLTIARMKNLCITSLSDYITIELPSITSLNIGGADYADRQNLLKDLKGVEKFSHLKSLNVSYNNNRLDISAIKNCIELEEVNLGFSNIQSISGIENLSVLTKIDLRNNNISSLKPLENLKNLEELNLSNNTISDTSSYIDSDGNTKTYNNLEILANLNKNGKLKKLYLAGNDNIINWSPLSSLNWTNKSGW